MRSFIVKHFGLYHISILFGVRFTPLRASTPIASLLILLALFDNMQLDIPYWITATLLAISIFLGFSYFRYWPVKWDELDDDQKVVYGDRYSLSLTESIDHHILKDNLSIQYKLKHFRNAFPILLPFIILIFTILKYLNIL